MDRSFTLYDLLQRNAHNWPHCVAFFDATDPDQVSTVTFAEFRELVDRLAFGLAARGLEAGDRVAVLALNSVTFAALYFAAARQGYVLVPINWRLQPSEVDLLWQRTSPRAIFVDAENLETLRGSERAAECSLQFLIAPEPGEDLDCTGDLGGPEVERAAIGDQHPAAIIATAAVDVIPRGALLSHQNLIVANLQEIAALGLGTADRSLLALPLFHIAALGHALAHFHAGGANVVTARFDAASSVRLIHELGITHFSDFPPVLGQILDAAADAGKNGALSTLRHVTGLDAPDMMTRLHEETSATFWTGFGQCETTGFVTLQNAREKLGSAGRPCEVCTVQLVDEYDRFVETGQPGEIVVRGPLVFLGYDGQPDVTEYTFRNGWHHTGDIGRFEDDGTLTYVARKAEKELIKPGGENVYPAEVEAALVQYEGVEAACVFGVPDAKWGEAIHAVLEVDDSFEGDLASVREFVGERIARFKRPHAIDTTSQLPRDESGEIDRDRVKQEWPRSES